MAAFLYILSGRAAIGGDLSNEKQIGPRNTVTLKKVTLLGSVSVEGNSEVGIYLVTVKDHRPSLSSTS